MIGRPPVEAGAVHVTVACATPAVALTPVGAPGAVAACAVTAFEADDAALVPVPFAAVTVNVYDVPPVSPVTVHGDEPAVHVSAPGDDVTV